MARSERDLLMHGIVYPVYHRVVKNLQNGQEAYDFAREHPEDVLETYRAYDQVLKMLAVLGYQERAIMPNTTKFLEKIGPIPLPPSLKHMMLYPFWTGYHGDAFQNLGLMMKRAEENPRESPGVSHPENRIIKFGTLVETPQAYIRAAGGHLIERTLFAALPTKWTHKWEKDDFLHAANELVLLWQLRTGDCPLYQFFTNPNDQGGLGWISVEDQQAFTEHYQAIFS